MRKSILLLLMAAAAGIGTATGYVARDAADLVPGTYYIDLGRAMAATPELTTRFEAMVKPILDRATQLKKSAADLDTEKGQLALMDPAALDFQTLKLSLAIREETLNGEMNLLQQARNNINDEMLYLASKRIHEAVDVLGAQKGYEAIQVSPIQLAKVPWEKDPKQSMDLIQQRNTFWIHPDRDVTDELIVILNQ
jgi:hypothetical protein